MEERVSWGRKVRREMGGVGEVGLVVDGGVEEERWRRVL